MNQTPHDLNAEFPEKIDALHDLRQGDAHFARLTDHYNAVNEKIHRAEQRLDLLTEAEEEMLRRERMVLKDQIARMLAGARAQI